MSRTGMKPVPIPDGVTVEVAGQEISVKGKLGEQAMTLMDEIEASVGDGHVVVKPRSESEQARAAWGMQRTLVNNMVTGVSNGFSVDLEINGVGYRAAVEGKELKLQLGFSHDVVYPIPDGVKIECERPTAISVSGANKQRVGQAAAEIRAFRKPEPYKGKGIKYVDEIIHRKEGKKK